MGRQFLFLQGPHGPFFRVLAQELRRRGSSILKVGLNRADDREWGGVGPYQAYTGAPEDWSAWVASLMEERGVTDLCLYGDTRAYHAAAAKAAKARGAAVHVFEEGYLRPFWVTYERGGSNGHSRLMEIDIEDMRPSTAVEGYEMEAPPPHWGAAWRHAYHGFRHHFDVLVRNGAYPGFAGHRPTSTSTELAYYLKRLLLLPLLTPEARAREARLLRSGKTYHLVLLQLAIDASMREHSPYASVTAFMEEVMEAFAVGAPAGHHLVFKSHPFEDGRERLETRMREMARKLGLERRVLFLHGGKLGPLLDRARTAVTVNSTAGQQALWRGLPLAVMGRSVYAKPEFAGEAELAEFFARPAAPDAEAYRVYRQFLLMSSQVRGSFYTKAGRRAAAQQIAPKMLDPLDPYERALQEADDLNSGATIAVFPLRSRSG